MMSFIACHYKKFLYKPVLNILTENIYMEVVLLVSLGNILSYKY